MRVLCIPKVSNKFFSSLVSGLEQNGCSVCTDKEQLFNYKHNFDIIHIHFPEGFYEWDNELQPFKVKQKARAFIETIRNISGSGIPLVWTVHNLKSHNPFYAKFSRYIYNNIAAYCSGFIIQGYSGEKSVLNTFPQLKGKPKAIIPLGNYIDSYPNEISKAEARKKLKIKPEKNVFLFIGQIRHYKDLPLLLKAYKQNREIQQKSVLIMVGKPSTKLYKLYLILKCFPNPGIVLKTEYIPDNELQYYLKAADICILPHKDIFMSSAVVLAQSFALPVITTDIGCIPDYVNPERGFLYKTGNLEDLQAKMLAAINSKNLSDMGSQARLFQEQNSWERMARKTVEFYKQLLNHKNG